MNMFIRSHARFAIEAEKAKAVLRKAKIVASDETGVRIEGTNSYHWVSLQGRRRASARLSRAARVVTETMNGHVPDVWISDRYPPSRTMARSIRHVWPISPAIRPSRWSMAWTICR